MDTEKKHTEKKHTEKKHTEKKHTEKKQISSDELPPVEVPTAALSPETLRAVLESYILREGTDYGTDELTLDVKVGNLERRIANGSAHLIFDPNTESITFLTDGEWKKLKS